MSCSVDNFPKDLFIVEGLNCDSAKTMSSDTLEDSNCESSKTAKTMSSDCDDSSDLDSNDGDHEMDNNLTSRVSFYPFNKCVLIPSRKELRHFKKDLWFTRRELNELREQDNIKREQDILSKKLATPTTPTVKKYPSSPTSSDTPSKIPTDRWQFPTVIPKVIARSKLSNQVVNLPSISVKDQSVTE